jgi:hypothetical protein
MVFYWSFQIQTKDKVQKFENQPQSPLLISLSILLLSPTGSLLSRPNSTSPLLFFFFQPKIKQAADPSFFRRPVYLSNPPIPLGPTDPLVHLSFPSLTVTDSRGPLVNSFPYLSPASSLCPPWLQHHAVSPWCPPLPPQPFLSFTTERTSMCRRHRIGSPSGTVSPPMLHRAFMVTGRWAPPPH